MNRIQMRRGTAAQWATTNPVLAAGEHGYVTGTDLFKVGDGATAWTTLRYAFSSGYASVVNVLGYGAVPGGIVDNSAAFAAAALDGIVYVPEGTWRVETPPLFARAGGGMVGVGDNTVITCPTYANRYIGVLPGTRGVQFTDFKMIGPGASSSLLAEARAITYGLNVDGTLAAAHWDSYGWFDNLTLENFGTGLSLAYADHTTFGTIRCINVGNAEPQRGYGISCSGSYVRGDRIIHTCTTTRGRHSIYWNGDAVGCHVEDVVSTGLDKNPVNCRTHDAGGRANTVGTVTAVDCNTVPEEAAGLCYWGIVSGLTGPNASHPSVRRIIATNCGGKIVRVSGHTNAEIGDVIVVNHTGFEVGSPEKYLIHFSDGAHGGHVGSVRAEGLNDNAIRGVVINESNDVLVDRLRLSGVYGRAVSFNTTSTGCKVRGVEPVTASVDVLFSDSSSGINVFELGPGYDTVTITDPANTTPNVMGMARIVLSYTGLCSVTNFTGGVEGQTLEVISTNANPTIVSDGAGNTIQLADQFTRPLGTRSVVRLRKSGTRWLEAGGSRFGVYNKFTTITDPANTTPDVSGLNRIVLSYTGACLVTTFTGGQEGQQLEVISSAPNATLVHSGGALGISLVGAANKVMGTRRRIQLVNYGNRWLEAG